MVGFLDGSGFGVMQPIQGVPKFQSTSLGQVVAVGKLDFGMLVGTNRGKLTLIQKSLGLGFFRLGNHIGIGHSCCKSNERQNHITFDSVSFSQLNKMGIAGGKLQGIHRPGVHRQPIGVVKLIPDHSTQIALAF